MKYTIEDHQALNDAVSRLNNIASSQLPYQKPALNIDQLVSTVGNATTYATNLFRSTRPVNELVQAGDTYKFVAGGSFAANTNDKTLDVLYNDAIIGTTGAYSFAGYSYKVESDIMFATSVAARCLTTISAFTTGAATLIGTYSVATTTTASAMDIVLRATATSNNDAVCNLANITKLLKQLTP